MNFLSFRFLFNIILLSLFISGCISNNKTEKKLRPAKGDRYYGGTLRYNEEEFLKSLYPLNVTEVTGHRITEQIYEGLVEFNQKSLAIEPSLAKSWEVNPEGTKYIFHLRTDVYFHDDPCFPNGQGRRFTAQDVKYCYDRLCYNNPSENQGFWIFKDVVKGANEYNEATSKKTTPPQGVEGVTVINDSTISIELYQPFSVFLSRMGLVFAKIYPKEAVEKYGSDMRIKCVGTGPYRLKLMKENEITFLTRNENYWKKDEFGNQLPYIDHIKVTYIKEKRAEFLSFKKGEIDFIYRFPLDMVDEILKPDGSLKDEFRQYQLQSKPVMAIQYYGFLNIHPIFKDKRVRQAFCYAVDKDKLCTYTLRNSGFPANYGVVPPGTGTYDATLVKGYKYNPEMAKKLMAQAGYPNGKNFPKITLQLNSGGGRNSQVAEAVQKMLEDVLNIKIELLTIPWAQHTEAVESAKAAFWRLGWVADYPEAENFLNLFLSKYVPDDVNEKTYINSYRYVNKNFDKVLEQALRTVNDKERNRLYAEADQIVINDAPILPLFYDVDHRLLQPNLHNFNQNAMEYRNYSIAYFSPN
ncbi:MAG: ABC transporter substrate-binding protein [Chitinophagales bacterium]|nr:ABC transporter substrate-binding protein [Chitinophagales bacterium]MCZ2394766.1 ABC transporter substrate-binding protein [Chitinophagales bacterium]